MQRHYHLSEREQTEPGVILRNETGLLTSVLSQKKLYTFCHSGLDPESSVFDLDSRFQGDDDSHHHCKEVLETLH